MWRSSTSCFCHCKEQSDVTVRDPCSVITKSLQGRTTLSALAAAIRSRPLAFLHKSTGRRWTKHRNTAETLTKYREKGYFYYV